MGYIVAKYLITAAVVVLVSEVARRSDKLGALLSSIPLVTVMTLLWLHFEKQPDSRIQNHAFYTFWYVLPTLPMFLLFPAIYPELGFWATLAISALLTVFLFLLMAFILKRFGISLL